MRRGAPLLPPGLRRGGAGHARVRPQGGERRGLALRRSGVGGRRKRDDHVRGGTSRDRSRILKRSPRSFRALENGRASASSPRATKAVRPRRRTLVLTHSSPSLPAAGYRRFDTRRRISRDVRQARARAPRPPGTPAALLAVEGRVAREEVDVLINRVWREGVVTDASAASRGDGQRRITVCVPGADGAPPADVVVFQDSSERVWARDAFQKRGAKTSGLRRGWAFSGVVSGQWLVRGHAAAVTSERREETFRWRARRRCTRRCTPIPQSLGGRRNSRRGRRARRRGARGAARAPAKKRAGWRDATSAFSAPERFERGKVRGVRPRRVLPRARRAFERQRVRSVRSVAAVQVPLRRVQAPAPGRRSRGFAGVDAGARDPAARTRQAGRADTLQHRVLAPVARTRAS